MRKNNAWLRPCGLSVGILAAGVLLSACGGAAPEPAEEAAQPTEAEVQEATRRAPSVDPAISVNALMVSLVDHAAHEIWDAPQNPPQDDNDWTQLEYHAMQLAAAGTLVSMGGTGPADAGWAALPAWQMYSQQLTAIGTQSMGAIQSRSVSELETIGSNLVDTCEGCHKEFKPDLPTEGLVHQPHYTH